MSAFKDYKTDDRLESKHGVVFDFGTYGLKCLRAGGTNKEFTQAFRDRYLAKQNVLSQAEQDRVMAEIYADTVVLDWFRKANTRSEPEWGKFDWKDGEVLEFNQENVVRVFMELPDFFDTIAARCSSFRNYRPGFVESAAKKS